MTEIKKTDIAKLLKDKNLMGSIVKNVSKNKDVIHKLAGDIADEVSDMIEHNTTIRRRIINAAISNPQFKKGVIKALTKEISI